MRIVWTKKARKRFGEILDYIQLKFGDTTRRSFISPIVHNLTPGFYTDAENVYVYDGLGLRNASLSHVAKRN